MSTTTVTEKAPLTSQANTFITVLAVKEDTPAEKPKQTPVFLLNSSDFIALQLYLQAGLELPATPELFESHYPKDAFDKYTKVDTGLYGVSYQPFHVVWIRLESKLLADSLVGSQVPAGFDARTLREVSGGSRWSHDHYWRKCCQFR